MIFVLKRVFQGALTLLALVTATFFLLRVLPGGPFDSENNLPPEVRANLEAHFHLNRPLIEQYGLYLSGLAHGDLGSSYQFLDQDVSDILRESLPVTLKLGGFSLLFALVIGLPVGLSSARYHNSKWDGVAMLWAAGGISLPAFLVAPLLIMIFSFWLDWLPPALLESPRSYILPVIALGLRPAALIARLIRASALDCIHSDFIRAARAKGVSETAILYKHILKNSLVPVFGVSGPLVANILSGSFIVELIFAIPGLGSHYINSVSNRDYPLILSLTILYAAILILANLAMDLLSAAVDPRMRIS